MISSLYTYQSKIEKLKKFVEDFKFQQDDNSYILLLNASGDKFTDFLKETIQDHRVA